MLRNDPHAPSTRSTQFFSMLGSRGIWHDGWKAVTNHPTIIGWSNFGDDEWEPYHTDVDRSECHNLAEQEPRRLRDIVSLWYAEARTRDSMQALGKRRQPSPR
jgi:arylsulfatase A-like enzyme